MRSGAFASPGSSPQSIQCCRFFCDHKQPGLAPEERAVWHTWEIAGALLLSADVLIPGLVESVGYILANDIVSYQFDVVRKIRMLDGQWPAQHVAG